MKLANYPSIILFTSLLAGCQISSNNKPNQVATITDAENKLTMLISDKSCDASFQCRVISYGERACGGPSRFDIYSIKNAKQEEVEFLANEITLFEQRYNQSNNAFSTCEHNTAPQTLCISKQCTVIERTE